MREDSSAPTSRIPWATLTAAEAAVRLGVDPELGLTARDVAARRARHGPNAIVERGRRGLLALLARQLRDPMVLVLLAAAGVASVIGEPQDTIAIVAIVVLNALVGAVQEYRAERALAALHALAALQARVRRDRRVVVVPSADLVPGDVVVLEAGNVVPADLRLLEAMRLEADEAALTGESHPAAKTAAAMADAEPVLAERHNMAWKGTTIVAGRGSGVVVATGMRTELGRIAALLDTAEEVRTPLQRRLDSLARRIAVVVLGLCAVIFGAGLLRGEEPTLMMLTAISLAVAAIPEALPAVVTIALALGARRMAARNALVRRLPAVEALGSVTCICADKTGTLTENRNRVSVVYARGRRAPDLASLGDGGDASRLLTAVLALDNDVRDRVDGGLEGDPTEVALVAAVLEAGCDRDALAARWPRVAELPFSSERGRMSTVHRTDDGWIVLTKGAPERVLARCTREAGASGECPLDRDAARAAAEAMARDGFRVIAVAARRLAQLGEPLDADRIEVDLSLLGLVGLLDPPRPAARDAVALCRSAGIRVVMITGDHPGTARAVARALGLEVSDDRVLTGRALARLGERELAEAITRTQVYARVAPEQKLIIVRALQRGGDAVAMTGDGVNDAPALHRADVGVAMGRSGTDVAREAADIVLLDDDFATIVSAVREGRRIYDNIRKFIRYVLTGNSGEIWTLFLAPFIGAPVPLLPIHILWVNLVTDGLPGIALTSEPAERDVMGRPPRPPSESVFAHGLWQHALWVGLLIGALTLAVQAAALRAGLPEWQSMTMTVLTFGQLFHVLAIRVERDSVFGAGVPSNPILLGTVVLTAVLHLLILYVPALQPIFRTHALGAGELVICIAVASVVFAAVEAEKALRRDRSPARGAARPERGG
jgi:Ca2+-transporting ATPase